MPAYLLATYQLLGELSQNSFSQSPVIPLLLLSVATAGSFNLQHTTVACLMSILQHCTLQLLEANTSRSHAPHRCIFIYSAPCIMPCISRTISNICWVGEWRYLHIEGEGAEKKVEGKIRFSCDGFVPPLAYFFSKCSSLWEKESKYLLKIGHQTGEAGLWRQFMDGILIAPSA